jgi:hypothetical protein
MKSGRKGAKTQSSFLAPLRPCVTFVAFLCDFALKKSPPFTNFHIHSNKYFLHEDIFPPKRVHGQRDKRAKVRRQDGKMARGRGSNCRLTV